jgi:uncharacterized protein (TIGR02145 family)
MLMFVMMNTASVSAQVTIGSLVDPPAYSLLELDTETVKGGLHLSRMTTDERNQLELDDKAAGLMIFNTSSGCLEIWVGSMWKSLCDNVFSTEVDTSLPSVPLELNGRYKIFGKILFDVNGGDISTYPEPYNTYPSDYPRSCDFNSTESTTSTYTLESFPKDLTNLPGAVQFTVDDPDELLESYETNSGDRTVTLTFKSLEEVKAVVGEVGRTNAKKITIRAFFLDNHQIRKGAELVVRVQNAPVGCSVRKVSDPGNPSSSIVDGWLTFMCYNLGADPDYGDPIAQKAYVPSPNTGNSTDRRVYGDLYQWGRVDDGHQRRDLAPENIWPSDHLGQKFGFTEDPVLDNTANINTTTGQVLETDIRFGKFIRRGPKEKEEIADGAGDWIGGTTTGIYNGRWSAKDANGKTQKAASDPCPKGWRVPTSTEWASIYGTTADCTSGQDCYTTNPKVNKWIQNFGTLPSEDFGTLGVSLTPSNENTTVYDSSPTLFLPAGDDRNSDHAMVDKSGTASIYWSSSVVPTNTPLRAYRMQCSIDGVYPHVTGHRSYGYSVRCVSE